MSNRNTYSPEEVEHLRKAARLLEEARKAEKRGSLSEAATLRREAQAYLQRIGRARETEDET